MPVALVRRQSSARTCTNSARTAESGRRPQTCAGSAEIRPCNPACVTTAAADSRRIRLSLQRNVFAQTLVIRNTKEFVRCVQHYAPVPKKKSKSLGTQMGGKRKGGGERRKRGEGAKHRTAIPTRESRLKGGSSSNETMRNHP
jgi:hypothetical protein